MLAGFCFVFGAWLPIGAGAPVASPGSVAVEEFVHRLEASYHDVRTLHAAFTQQYRWGEQTRLESGDVYLARGGRMRWEYRRPLDKLFLSDGKNVWLYVPEEKQATRSSVKSSEDIRIPLRLLLARVDLYKVFGKIEFADQAFPAAPGSRILRANPRRPEEQGFEEVLFEVDPAFDLRRLIVVYSDHSRMDFTFSLIQRNLPLSGGLFHFNPPSGTELIEQR
jgi:outer membrane lipoprotein carrier protein